MRKRKKGASGIVKTIPLSIALAALSTGTAFADTEATQLVQVEKDGYYYTFDLAQLSNEAYAKQVRDALKEAFIAEDKSILVQVGDDEWVEFGKNASAERTLDDIKKNPNSYRPDDSAITPYPEG
jgi:hypothetical protein